MRRVFRVGLVALAALYPNLNFWSKVLKSANEDMFD